MLSPQFGELVKQTIAGLMRKDTTTAGIATASGLNFYYLEPKAKPLYPVFYPLLASTPRVNPMFNGQKIGGPAVNWKAIVSIDSGGYPALPEGQRNATMNFTTRNYSAQYKFLGKDVNTTFQAQQTGLGLDDNIAVAQFGMLNALLNDEERMLLFGNSGPASVGGNGYALGTTPTPTVALSTSASTIPASTNCSVFCVALTPWGASLATSNGVRLPFLQTGADGGTFSINGGTGVVSAASSVVATTSGNQSIQASVAAINGAVAYAWYLDTTDASAPSKANAFFVGVTAFPVITISAVPSTSNQAASATDPNTNKGLTTDNSYNTLDFDGIMTWHFGTAGSSQPAYLADLGGAGFTSNGDGTIKEFEAVADYLWLNYKVSPDAIYLGGSLIQSASRAIMTSSSGPGAQRVIMERDADGRVTGGQIVTAYNWKYSNTAAPKTIPLRAHPWAPPGTVLFDITTNPYPAAGNDIPAVRRIVSLEDHFSIKWPYRTLKHELGVYTFETLEHYLPFCGGILTGVANKVS